MEPFKRHADASNRDLSSDSVHACMHAYAYTNGLTGIEPLIQSLVLQMKMKTVLLSVLVLSMVSLSMSPGSAKAEYPLEQSANVEIGVLLVNVEKVDLAAS